jgi:hypothetical protein
VCLYASARAQMPPVRLGASRRPAANLTEL